MKNVEANLNVSFVEIPSFSEKTFSASCKKTGGN